MSINKHYVSRAIKDKTVVDVEKLLSHSRAVNVNFPATVSFSALMSSSERPPKFNISLFSLENNTHDTDLVFQNILK